MAAIITIGLAWAQSPAVKIAAGGLKAVKGIVNANKSLQQAQNQVRFQYRSQLRTQTITSPATTTSANIPKAAIVNPTSLDPNRLIRPETKQAQVAINTLYDEDWIEVGQITLKRIRVLNGEIGIPRYEDGYGELPFKEIKAVLYVKEFNNGILISRPILFRCI